MLPASSLDEVKLKTPVKGEGRPKRERKSAAVNATMEDVVINDIGESCVDACESRQKSRRYWTRRTRNNTRFLSRWKI